ncbi:MAG: hypothetical protein KC656_01130 [Myxococcales bacterium]|nr:hypothetical protein [Myxococcales bacterium]
MIALLSLAGAAEEEEVEKPWKANLHGDLKTFFTATIPYEHVLMPPDPTGQGVFDARLKLEAAWGDSLRLQVHQTATAITAASGAMTRTGVGLTAPEVVKLSWVATDQDLTFRGRVDRLSLAWSTPGFDLTVGRQPVTFGHAQVFTPLDLVNPFNPAFIDQEYKPGVDSLRADVYAGTASTLTLVAAYAGSWDREGLVTAVYGQSTVGVTDIGLFAGSVRGDAVFGTSVVTAVGPAGITGDGTVTLPAGGGDPFVRASLSGFFRPGPNTTIALEGYVQTLGATRPSDYLKTTVDPHFARSEIWLMGVGYAALAVSQQVTPTVTTSLALVANPLDPSAFVAPNLGWSVANNVDFVLGGFVGLGARPDDITLLDLIGPDGAPLSVDQLTYLNSEFGTYPGVIFAQAKIYY